MKAKIIKDAQCAYTKECKNNQCYFRLRDVFDYPPFLHDGFDEQVEKAVKRAGIELPAHPPHGLIDPLIPKFKACPVTNGIGIICYDGIFDNYDEVEEK